MQQCANVQKKDPFMVQQMPELRNRILEGRNWEEIASYQAENFFSQTKDKREFDLLIELANTYGNEAVDTIMDGFVCPNGDCRKTAVQRCSRCKSEWYCSRTCQVEHYKKEHKNVCKIWAAQVEEKKKNNKENIGGIKTKVDDKKEDFIIKESTKINKIEEPFKVVTKVKEEEKKPVKVEEIIKPVKVEEPAKPAKIEEPVKPVEIEVKVE